MISGIAPSTTIFIDSITVLVLFLNTIYARLFTEYPRKIPSLILASNFPRFSRSLRIKHLLPNTQKYLTLGLFPFHISYKVFLVPVRKKFNSKYGKMYSWLPPKTFEVYPDTLMLASYFATSLALLCLFLISGLIFVLLF